MRKLPSGARRYVFLVMVGLTMSGFMSGVLTLVNVGLSAAFFLRWVSAWATGFIVALPVAIFVIPLAERISYSLVEPAPEVDSDAEVEG